MSIRHKKVYNSLDVGLKDDWNDDHHYNPYDEILFCTTFVESNFSDTWDSTQTTGATGPAVSMADSHAFMVLDSTADIGDIATIRMKLGGTAGNITQKTDTPVLTLSVRLISPAGTGTTHEFGFFVDTDTPFTAKQKGMYFRIKDNKVYAVTGNGANETTTEIGTASEYAVYKIQITSSDVRFYIDDLDVIEATHTTYITTDELTIKYSTIENAFLNLFFRMT